MKDNPEKNYEEWFKKAEEDRLNANSILTHRDGAPSGVCFLSQQVAEKYLKGFLIFLNKEFPKVHDLLELESLIFLVNHEIKNHEKELDLLSTFYVETRYPGDYPEFTWQDAEQAYAAALNIKKFVLDKIKSEHE